MDCSPPGSSIHGIFQARVLEWGAIAFSVENKIILTPSTRYQIWPTVAIVAGEGNGTPLQYSRLENLMDGGAWWAAARGVAKSWT